MASSACRRIPSALEGPVEGPVEPGEQQELLHRCRRRASRHGFFPFLPRLFLWRSSLDLLPSAGVSSARLPFLPSKIAPTASSPEAKLVAMSNSSFESTGGLRPSSRTRSRHMVPSRKAWTISDYAMLGSSIQRLRSAV
jgi:hypothetical protein